jgi:hypothetical protein
MDEIISYAELAGVTRLFDTHFTFALPIFRSSHSKGTALIQEVTDNGTIAGFVSVKIDPDSFRPISAIGGRRLGEPAFLAFELAPAEFHVAEYINLLPIVRKLLERDEIIALPFTRSSMATFCGETKIAEQADLHALEKLPSSGGSRAYYRLNVLIRNKIKDIFLNYVNGELPLPRFRLIEDDRGLTVELNGDASDRDIAAMRACLARRKSDFALLVRGANRRWQCRVSFAMKGRFVENDPYRGMRPRLLLFARRLLLSARENRIGPEDLVQDALAKTLEGKDKLSRGDKLFKIICKNMQTIYRNYNPRYRPNRMYIAQPESVTPKTDQNVREPYERNSVDGLYTNHEEVINLSKQGMDADSISTTLKTPKEVVQYILNLRGGALPR